MKLLQHFDYFAVAWLQTRVDSWATISRVSVSVGELSTLREAGRGERKENQARRRKQVGLNWEPVTGWRGCGLNGVLLVTYLEYQKTKQHWRKERWRSKELRVDFLHVPRKIKSHIPMPSALHERQLINKSSYFVAISIFVKKSTR